MFRYAFPCSIAEIRFAAAAETLPPFAVTKAGLKLDDDVRSSVLSEVQMVTPSGKPGNAGGSVAKPAVPENAMAIVR